MDSELKQQLDRMEKFLMQHMVTKEEFSELQSEVKEVKQSVHSLITSVEGLATLIKNYSEEHAAIKHQISVMQDWIRKVSEKVGVEFKL